MNRVRPGAVFFLLMAACCCVIAATGPPAAWYSVPLLLALFGALLFLTRTWRDRGFYCVCGGEPLVVACGAVNIWGGLFVVWMLAGIVMEALGMWKGQRDIRAFAAFCCITLVVAVMIQLANHVLLPLIILGTATVMFVAVQAVSGYRLKKHCAGARS
jgi:hypothetical protein